MPHNTLCLPPKFCMLLFSNAPGRTAYSLERVKHVKIIIIKKAILSHEEKKARALHVHHIFYTV